MYAPDQTNKPRFMAPSQPPSGGSRMPNGPAGFPQQPPFNGGGNPPQPRPFYNGEARPPAVNGAMSGPGPNPQFPPRMPGIPNSASSSNAPPPPQPNNFRNAGPPPPNSGAANLVGQPPRGQFPMPPTSASSNRPPPPTNQNQQPGMQRPPFPPTQTQTPPTFYQGSPAAQPGQPRANVPPPPNMAFNNSMAGQTQSIGGGGMHPPPPTISTSNAPNSGPTGPPPISSQQNVTNDRPNELPVPFHGQGQYSHQVNPFMQNSPVPTPGNSEPASRKSSRGASPVSEIAFDALEGQFTAGHGAPSPLVSSANHSPVPGSRTAPTTATPPNTFTPLARGATNTPPLAQPPAQPGMTQQPLPPRPGFPQQQPGVQTTRPMMNPPGFGPPPPRYGAAPPPPTSAGYGQPPPSSTSSHPPPPSSIPNASGFPGQMPPPPPASGSGGSYPPPPTSLTSSRYPQPPMGTQHGGMPPMGQQPPQTYQGHIPPQSQGYQPGGGGYPSQPMIPPGGGGGSYPNNVPGMTANFGQMSIPDNQRTINLMNEKNLISPDGLETSAPVFQHDFKKNNCSPDVFRCTLNAIPSTSSLLQKARLPLGIIIHPFRDMSIEVDGQLPVIQSSVIVRCRSCRTYINPFVTFVDTKRWKCNLCFRVNELPDEFSFDPVSKSYGDPQRRPEIKSATIEFIAPSEYMLRPPQPAVYLFLLDVSFNAVETGYLSQFSQILLEELNKLPGDGRTSVGFICYDRVLYYFNLSEGLSQPQMLCVPDLEDPFLPCPDNLLVNLQESKDLIVDFLNQLPNLFKGNLETGSALGPALHSAHKLMGPTGGRVTVMQTCLPTVGVGALENRETANSGKNTANIGPATDFYKKLSLDFSAQQVAVDLFLMSGQYADLASLSCISKYSAGQVFFFPSLHSVRNPALMEKFDTDLRRYLTRKIGFEAVMRIRCSRGLSIHTFHGNFFVRSTDLLSLPNINPDAGFGMQMSIEDNLTDSSSVSFQAALLYTSSKGERRIRVHTLCVPVSSQLSEVFNSADQQGITCLLSKMAVDRSINSSISDARDALINAVLDSLTAYTQSTRGSDKSTTLLAPHSLRLLPMFILALMKSTAFGLASSTKLDHRVFAMQEFKVQPLCYLIQTLYPHLYPLHRLNTEKPIKRGKEEIPSAPYLQLSSANIDRTGLFLMDAGQSMYLLVGSGIGETMCRDVFDQPNLASIPEGLMDLPELENPTSENIRSFVNYLMDSRPFGATFLVVRDDSKHRFLFFQHMLEDRTESSMSYHEYLQFLQGKAK